MVYKYFQVCTVSSLEIVNYFKLKDKISYQITLKLMLLFALHFHSETFKIIRSRISEIS